MPHHPPWRNRACVLCESANDGSLRYLKPGGRQGPWQRVTHGERSGKLKREQLRQQAANQFIGSLQGRTVIIFGTGPMVRRITGSQIKHLKDRSDVALVGINAAPGIAGRLWGVDPNATFDFVMAADGETTVWQPWGWHWLKDTPIFTRTRFYDGRRMPLISWHAPSPCLPRLFWRDSVTGAVNLSILALGRPSRPKYCAGPNGDWPEVRARPAAEGRIILVGVEHNRWDHAYTGDERFGLTDDPDRPWRNMDYKIEGHRIIGAFAKSMGINVLNAAPWSLVREHEFCDFEEALNLPESLRTGVTARGLAA